jgi:hypothetical protein
MLGSKRVSRGFEERFDYEKKLEEEQFSHVWKIVTPISRSVERELRVAKECEEDCRVRIC